ncbi:MAG: hypothetical protein IT532_02850 [Burkholderiales bacterium]|nr:hypothetical protein [Burkholderiales bacterium]
MLAFRSPRGDPAHGTSVGARVAERLAALPGHDEPDHDEVAVLARLSGLMSDLRGWARQPDEATAEAMAGVDAAVRQAYRSATRRHVTRDRAASVHTPQEARAVVEECLLRLAQTWLWLALPWTMPAADAAAGHPGSASVFARGLRTSTAVLKWSCLWHAAVPAGLWADACRLLSCAEALGVARAWVRLDPGADWYSCAEREFLKGCMLATSGPERMSPPQVDAVERALEFCADALVLSPLEDRRLRFVIDLEDGMPPRTAAGHFGPSSRSLGLDCYDVRLDDLIKRVASGRLRASAFGTVLDQPLVLRTLLQVRDRWTAHHH